MRIHYPDAEQHFTWLFLVIEASSPKSFKLSISTVNLKFQCLLKEPWDQQGARSSCAELHRSQHLHVARLILWNRKMTVEIPEGFLQVTHSFSIQATGGVKPITALQLTDAARGGVSGTADISILSNCPQQVYAVVKHQRIFICVITFDFRTKYSFSHNVGGVFQNIIVTFFIAWAHSELRELNCKNKQGKKSAKISFRLWHIFMKL